MLDGAEAITVELPERARAHPASRGDRRRPGALDASGEKGERGRERETKSRSAESGRGTGHGADTSLTPGGAGFYRRTLSWVKPGSVTKAPSSGLGPASPQIHEHACFRDRNRS